MMIEHKIEKYLNEGKSLKDFEEVDEPGFPPKGTELMIPDALGQEYEHFIFMGKKGKDYYFKDVQRNDIFGFDKKRSKAMIRKAKIKE